MRISLRTLILLVTLAAVATPYVVEATPRVIAWWNVPSEDELLKECNHLVSNGKFGEAERTALFAVKHYPDSYAAHENLWQIRIIAEVVESSRFGGLRPILDDVILLPQGESESSDSM